MSKQTLYPLKFKPILKEKVWGGNKLHSHLNKDKLENAGESWELSAVPGSVSVVTNGPLGGKDLQELVDDYGAQLLGKHVFQKFGNNFPLLFKFIDARQDLSVQLHPSDELARERHQSFGKNEMWYIVQADRTARLILGFNRPMDKETYRAALKEGNITDILKEVPVTEGSAFYVSTGTVHAIGEGILLAEIQQTSDITYRIYDWDRPDKDGHMRELHNDLALEAIHFGPRTAELPYREQYNKPATLARSLYFNTDKLLLNKSYTHHLEDRDTFTVLMCVEGEGILKSEGPELHIAKGETVLLPASLKFVNIITENCTLLDVTIP